MYIYCSGRLNRNVRFFYKTLTKVSPARLKLWAIFIYNNMDLRKEIQVALNSCQPNTNRVDKVEKIANDYALKFANWYRLKCIVSNFDMYMSVEDAFEIFKKNN